MNFKEASNRAALEAVKIAAFLLALAQIPFLLDVLEERYWNPKGMITLALTFAVFWLLAFAFGLFHFWNRRRS